MKWSAWFKELDAFPKVLDNYKVSSASGGLVSLLTFSIIGLLVTWEVLFFVGVDRVYTYTVDTSATEAQLDINVDVDIHTMCDIISVDVIDLSGLTLNANIQKTEIVYDLTERQAQWLGDQQRQRDAAHDIADVVKGNAKQLFKDMPSREGGADTREEANGCRLTGTIHVRKVQGNFHFTAGHTVHTSSGHFHINTNQEGINFTHRINRLSFGEDFPGLVNPLDGEEVVLHDGKLSVQYAMSIVPTIYIAPDGTMRHTNQYSFTVHNAEGFPGVFFKYELNPILMEIADKPRSILRSMVRMAGVVGGIFATSVVFHNMVAAISNRILRNGPEMDSFGEKLARN